jgi:adenylate cyclase class 2
MSIEVELKFPVHSFDSVLEKLDEMGCTPGAPVAEENLVFDTPEGTLSTMGILLRVRRSKGETLLTVKAPVDVRTSMKIREEHEILLPVGGDEVSALLGALGYRVVASYQKTRRRSRIDSVTVCLDTLRFGRFVELEASSEGQIVRAVRKLDLDFRSGLAESYLTLAARSGSRESF